MERKIQRPQGDTPLYCLYDGQTEEQPAYLCLDLRTGELSADYSGEIGNGCSFDVYHGVVRRYSLPPTVTQTALDKLEQDQQFQNLISVILQGAETYTDSNCSEKAGLSEEGQEAEYDLELLLQSFFDEEDVWSAWDVSDWLGELSVDDILRGESIEIASDRIRKYATGERVILTGDVHDYIRQRIEVCE